MDFEDAEAGGLVFVRYAQYFAFAGDLALRVALGRWAAAEEGSYLRPLRHCATRAGRLADLLGAPHKGHPGSSAMAGQAGNAPGLRSVLATS